MKQITAVIQPHMLSKVEHALHELPRCPGFTLLSARGHGRGRAHGHAYQPTEQNMDARAKVALLIVCSDTLAPSIVDAIRRSAHTGLPGDGIIAVCEATEVVRIGTGEIGDNSV